VDRKKDQRLEVIVEQCKEYQSYFPEPVRNWHDLINIADKLVPMLGIDRPVFEGAVKTMGLKHAATVVLCILEKIATIHNPGGFLRRLTQAAQSGQFDWGGVAPKQVIMA
jgi:replication initiation protein RepC